MNQFDERVRRARLTKTQQKIAEHISENYKKNICFMTANEIAAEIGVSPSSVIKLSGVLGYSNFEEMKLTIREDILSSDETDYTGTSFLSQRLVSSLSEIEHSSPLHIYYKNIQTIVESVFTRNELDKFLKATEILLQSHSIYIAGFSGSRSVADSFSIHMRRIFPRVITLRHADSDIVTRMANISPSDCLVLISYTRYANMAFKMNRIARNFGAKIIVITDSISAPVAEGADVIFVTERENGTFFNCSVGPIMVTELLTFFVSPKRANTTQRHLDMIDTLVKDENLF